MELMNKNNSGFFGTIKNIFTGLNILKEQDILILVNRAIKQIKIFEDESQTLKERQKAKIRKDKIISKLCYTAYKPNSGDKTEFGAKRYALHFLVSMNMSILGEK
ncbi:MAG: hypothetical protein ACJA02_000754 [Myxococcota bacterium]|jgi:hypothetical protein